MGLDFSAQIGQLRELLAGSDADHPKRFWRGGYKRRRRWRTEQCGSRRQCVWLDLSHLPISSGIQELSEDRFRLVLNEYLNWVQRSYKHARLYGIESLPATAERPVRELSRVFVPLTLRESGARHQSGTLSQLLSVSDRIAIVGGAGSGKSTVLSYLAVTLAAASVTGAAPESFNFREAEPADARSVAIPCALPAASPLM